MYSLFCVLGYEDKPYVEFLRSKNLSSNVLHYILHAIAMVTEATPTTEVSNVVCCMCLHQLITSYVDVVYDALFGNCSFRTF